jgi:hypothetical protein
MPLRPLHSSVVRHVARLGRFVRGAVGMGLAWSVPWGVAGMVLSPYLWTLDWTATPRSLSDALAVAGTFGAAVAWYGFLAGAIFSVVLAIAARRRTLHEITKSRMAAWGVASSALFTVPPMVSMLLGRVDGWRESDAVVVIGSALLSAGCAVASLVVARRAEDARELAESEVDVGDALRAFLPANAMLRSGRHAVVLPANVEPERVPIP